MSIIGIDLDGTLAKYNGFIAPDVIDAPDMKFVSLIKSLYEHGHDLYIWSCRADFVVRAWLKKHSLAHYFIGVNRSPATSDSIKASFDFYIGDEALNWDGNNGDQIFQYIESKSGTVDRCTTDRDKEFMSHQPVPYLAGTGRGYLDMFEHHWRRLWPLDNPKKIAFLTICSHAKPYSKSYIHSNIMRQLFKVNLLDEIDYIHISNAGIIPSSAEMTYPFNAYDHDGSQMSVENQEYFTKVLTERMRWWADNVGINYKKIIVYLRRGKTWASTEQGLKGLDPLMVAASIDLNNYPKHARLYDPDDCLASANNVERLIRAMRQHIKGKP